MRELVVFGIVGVLATLVHYVSALLFVEGVGLAELTANFLAYCLAVGVSYFGHAIFTFRAPVSKKGFLKFIVVSLTALALSQALLYTLGRLGWFGFRINMLVVVCSIPVFSFVMNKFWVYRAPAIDARPVCRE